jgi:gas vesicle protein
MTDRKYYSYEAEQLVRRQRIVSALVFLALGLGIGAVMALLFAPTSGKKMRSELADSAEDTFEGGRDATNRTLERLQSSLDDLRERVEERIKDLG